MNVSFEQKDPKTPNPPYLPPFERPERKNKNSNKAPRNLTLVLDLDETLLHHFNVSFYIKLLF